MEGVSVGLADYFPVDAIRSGVTRMRTSRVEAVLIVD